MYWNWWSTIKSSRWGWQRHHGRVGLGSPETEAALLQQSDWRRMWGTPKWFEKGEPSCAAFQWNSHFVRFLCDLWAQSHYMKSVKPNVSLLLHVSCLKNKSFIFIHGLLGCSWLVTVSLFYFQPFTGKIPRGTSRLSDLGRWKGWQPKPCHSLHAGCVHSVHRRQPRGILWSWCCISWG